MAYNCEHKAAYEDSKEDFKDRDEADPRFMEHCKEQGAPLVHYSAVPDPTTLGDEFILAKTKRLYICRIKGKQWGLRAMPKEIDRGALVSIGGGEYNFDARPKPKDWHLPKTRGTETDYSGYMKEYQVSGRGRGHGTLRLYGYKIEKVLGTGLWAMLANSCCSGGGATGTNNCEWKMVGGTSTNEPNKVALGLFAKRVIRQGGRSQSPASGWCHIRRRLTANSQRAWGACSQRTTATASTRQKLRKERKTCYVT
jgi:hypothetical protein